MSHQEYYYYNYGYVAQAGTQPGQQSPIQPGQSAQVVQPTQQTPSHMPNQPQASGIAGVQGAPVQVPNTPRQPYASPVVFHYKRYSPASTSPVTMTTATMDPGSTHTSPMHVSAVASSPAQSTHHTTAHIAGVHSSPTNVTSAATMTSPVTLTSPITMTSPVALTATGASWYVPPQMRHTPPPATEAEYDYYSKPKPLYPAPPQTALQPTITQMPSVISQGPPQVVPQVSSQVMQTQLASPGGQPQPVPLAQAPYNQRSYAYQYARPERGGGRDGLREVVSRPRSHSSTQSAHAGAGGTTTAPRHRRRSVPRLDANVKYPVNYPAHAVPPEMNVMTGPPDNSWAVLPPRPSQIQSRRYATGSDKRNYLTALEYEINGQSIIWDYYTGYVHLTGIWKAIGNSKADIVKLLDNSPELEPVIRRVRGGFLKIQGTWVPFEVARTLAKHVCYYVRFALVPIFGTEFPAQCTQPHEPGFGTLQLNMPSNFDLLLNSPHGSQKSTTVSHSTIAPSTATIASPHKSVGPPHISNTSSLSATHPAIGTAGSATTKVAASSSRSMHSVSSPSLPNFAPTLFPRRNSATGSKNPHRRTSSLGSKLPIPNNIAPLTSVMAATTTPTSLSHAAGTVGSSSSIAGERRASEKRRRPRTNSAPSADQLELAFESAAPSLARTSVAELYDENVFEEEELEPASPPPLPRKVSFSNEAQVSVSTDEFLAMLKATRSLQQISTGRIVKDVGGDFECAGRKFSWDGSDRLVNVTNFETPASSTIQKATEQPAGSESVNASTTSSEAGAVGLSALGSSQQPAGHSPTGQELPAVHTISAVQPAPAPQTTQAGGTHGTPSPFSSAPSRSPSLSASPASSTEPKLEPSPPVEVRGRLPSLTTILNI